MHHRESFFDRLGALASKTDQALALLWFSERVEGNDRTEMRVLSDLFAQARLPRPNSTRLELTLRSHRSVLVTKAGLRLHRDKYKVLDREFAFLFSPAPELKERFDLSKTPFLSEADLERAREMASLYAVAYCLENSVRCLISRVLSNKLGTNWWDAAASTGMKRKHDDRVAQEQKRRWAPARAEFGPLYSVDWGDLCTLMRKYEADFLPFIGEVNFLHRFDDLGVFRNLIAHHGYFGDLKDIKRLELAWEDWVGQLRDQPATRAA